MGDPFLSRPVITGPQGRPPVKRLMYLLWPSENGMWVSSKAMMQLPTPTDALEHPSLGQRRRRYAKPGASGQWTVRILAGSVYLPTSQPPECAR
jgi:hypothetical protein